MSKIRPVEDRILVKMSPNANMVGGLHLPDTIVPHALYGIVVAQGPGKATDLTGERAPMPCVVGEYVMIQVHAGVDIGHNDLRIVAPRDILAVIDEPDYAPEAA